MSDLFEQDISENEEDISKLEDADFKAYEDEGDEHGEEEAAGDAKAGAKKEGK